MEDNNLPPFLQKKIVLRQLHSTKSRIHGAGLHTVCESARCPNITECFSEGTATFMLLGNVCTRNCGFCSVKKGVPQEVSERESGAVADAACALGLRYVVLTSVTRDDLPDGGAGHFRRVVSELKRKLRNVTVEVLTPDFRGDERAWKVISESEMDVFAHNIETVSKFYRTVRPGASYQRSLKLLNFVHKERSDVIIKSGLMVGLGEEIDEVKGVLIDLKDAGCDIVTIGQYLKPTISSLDVRRYVQEDEYREYMEFGKKIGLKYVFGGPFVRSSYRAEYLFKNFMKMDSIPVEHKN
jgi:lipoic acid synthetase